jgi:hypothetical protein
MGLRAVAVISGARVWAASNEFAPATRPNQVGVGHVHGWRLPQNVLARQSLHITQATHLGALALGSGRDRRLQVGIQNANQFGD